MSKLHRKLIQISRDLIHLPNSEAKHFSFVCDGNKVLSIGYNNGWKTHPTSNKFNHRFNAIHSEFDSIRRYQGKISDIQYYTLYNVRLLKNGLPAIAKPCIPCQSMLASFGINKLYYTNREGEFVAWNS